MATLVRPNLSAPNGRAKFYWLTTIVATDLTPTQLEITAGDDITAAVNAVSGGDDQPQYEDFDLMDDSTAAKVFVGSNLNELSLVCGYESQEATAGDIYTVLASGDAGYLVVCPSGNAGTGGEPAWVFKAEVSTMSDVIAARSVTRTNVSFSVNRRERVTLPASA
jgi:hypothetical protein